MLETIGRKAKEASFLLGKTPTVKKNAALLAVADELNSRAEEILAANAKDIENAKKNGMKESLIKLFFEQLKNRLKMMSIFKYNII